MKKCTLVLVIVLYLSAYQSSPGQNLVVNGSAETTSVDSVLPGWTMVLGQWASVVDTDGNYAPPKDGNRIFFAGRDSVGILQQDVDVSYLNHPIDSGYQAFYFSGFVRSYNQEHPDESRMVVQCLNSTKSIVLYTFDTYNISSVKGWREFNKTILAPKRTRFIRIKLIATRHSGVENDGYFDSILLEKWMEPGQ